MTFTDFSKLLSNIEATPKRLEITDLLVGLIKQTNPEEIEKAVNLSLSQLAPLYKDIDFNMAEKTIVRSLASSCNLEGKTVLENFKRIGDLGEVASELKLKEQNSKRKTTVQSAKLSVSDVFSHLLNIATQSGKDSQDRKIGETSELLRELDPLSAKYVVRIILGNLRLGFSDRTVLDALSNIIAGDKSARKKLEEIYNVRPDIGWMANKIQDSRFKIQEMRKTHHALRITHYDSMRLTGNS